MARVVWSSPYLMDIPGLAGSCIQVSSLDSEVWCQSSPLVSNSTDEPMCEAVCLEAVKRSLCK